MLAKQCDICGAYYNCYHNLVYNGIILANIDDDGKNYEKRKHIDMCPHCMDRFHDFMLKWRGERITNAE